jgi:DNA polymerase-3 subunit alpha
VGRTGPDQRRKKPNRLLLFRSPLDDIKVLWKQTVSINLARAASAVSEETYQVMGVINDIRVIVTKKGSKMAWLQLEDYNGSIELVVFPKVFEEIEERLEVDSIMGFKGKIEARDDKAQFMVDELIEPEELKILRSLGLHIEVNNPWMEEKKWDDIRELFLEHPGDPKSIFI